MRPPNFGSPISYFLPLPSYIGIGPCPIHEVVVTAVRKAVRAVVAGDDYAGVLQLVLQVSVLLPLLSLP